MGASPMVVHPPWVMAGVSRRHGCGRVAPRPAGGPTARLTEREQRPGRARTHPVLVMANSPGPLARSPPPHPKARSRRADRGVLPVQPPVRSPIGTKYSVPGLPHPFVRRPRVEALLSRRRRRRFTVVSGLPGAGKTTLAAAWARSSPRRQVAWVNLDAHDNEPGRFARAVIGALVGASALADEVDDIDLVPGADTAALDVILGRLAPGGWTLVVDDAHELRSPEAIATLGHLLERSPEGLSMILCTRADPPVAVGRLRLSGRLGEIRNADLEFTREEATELFAAHGLGTVPDDVRALWSRTGGWAAGLRLAAVALEREPDGAAFVRSATATEEVVADYLVEELLARQDERTQSFLLCTSITHHLTPELAACVAGVDVDEARERLDRLQGTGVFITTSDPDGYRHHALFAELLRACLRHRHPEVVPELHRRGAGGGPARAPRPR